MCPTFSLCDEAFADVIHQQNTIGEPDDAIYKFQSLSNHKFSSKVIYEIVKNNPYYYRTIIENNPEYENRIRLFMLRFDPEIYAFGEALPYCIPLYNNMEYLSSNSSNIPW